MKDTVSRGTRIVTIPSKFFMSCDMGINIPLSEGLKNTELGFDSCKHLYLCNFLLEDMEKEDSFFKPYYDTLPEDITNIPILWSNRELNWFRGCYFVLFPPFLISSPPSCVIVFQISIRTINGCVM